jgi:amino acid adenylation domain-containing protein
MLPARTADAIKTLAASLGVNPSILFLGAFSLLLHRLSGDDDLLIGMPTAGRPESRFDAVVGYFVNMVCIRSRISRRQNAAGFLRDLQLTVADALDHSDYPFPALLNALDIARDRAASPLFQTVFAYQNFVQPGDLSDQDGVLSDAPAIEILAGVNQEGSHDLALEVYHGNSTVRLRFDYDTALFTGETISRAMSGYVRLLEAILSRPDAAIADLPLLSAEERRQIVTEWNADAAAHDASVPVIASFERQARLVPEQIALQGEHGSLSYRALDRQSSALARGLLAAGVVQGDAVGVCMKDRQKMIVAMLGIWKVAAIYVPIGTDQPAVRLRHLLDDSRVRLLVTDPAARDRIAEQYSDGGPTCLVPDDLPQALSGSSPDLSPRIDPDNAAYVIYTSGSTGQPKGVVIPHRAIAHHCRVVSAYYQLTPQDRILQFAPLSVDASLEQILPGLLYGATVIVRPERLWTAHEFRQAIVGLGLTVIDVPPSYLHELLLDIGDDAADLGSLRLAVTGGETLRPETVALWRAGPFASRRLVNAYGPTETTITSTVFEAGAFDPASCATVPIGRPLPGESAYILDRHGEPVPFGVAGELHIGGAGLALGYLGRPELTREAFLDNPVAPGSLVYKTGDRARWLADGSIALLGRVDDQVKVRGFRVACGEVEAALRRLDPVQDAAVLCRTVNASEQLVAFVVYGAGVQPPAVTELKQALAGVLPEYMIPAAIVALASLPMTASGKVDRASLMQRDLAAPQATGDTAPRNETEARLGQIWREVLQRPHVGIHDSFFDLGGHSLLALRLMALIQQRFGRDLPLSALFEAPDIARQARLLGGETPDWSPLVCLTAPEGEKAPFFCVHAVAGTVLCYQQLALLIGQGRPVYALQAPDPIVGAHPGTVDGLAERYVAAIRGVRPHGPYHLGGWSMGGVIAYEMAQQLHAAGEPVARLALIDSYRPDVVLGIEKALGAVSQPPDAGGGVLLNANRRAMDSYQPRPYPNGAAVFTAEAVTIDPGWSACVGGKLITGSLPGDHDSLLQPPHVHVLADRLARYLDNGI